MRLSPAAGGARVIVGALAGPGDQSREVLDEQRVVLHDAARPPVEPAPPVLGWPALSTGTLLGDATVIVAFNAAALGVLAVFWLRGRRDPPLSP